MIPDGSLSTQALHVLSLAVGALGPAAPTRRYIAAGSETDPAWDDEQLVVSITEGNIVEGVTATPGRIPTPHTGSPGRVPMLEQRFVVEVVKCTPTSSDEGEAVDHTALTGYGTLMMGLGEKLWNVFEGAARDGTLAVDPRKLATYRTERMSFIGPSGAYSAVRHTFTATVV